MSEEPKLKKKKTLELSRRDSIAFLESLLNPTEPNEALKEAARKHKELVDDKT